MAVFTCKACGGTFTDPQPDNTRYFHTCPPLSAAELIGGALPPQGDPDGSIAALVVKAKGAASVDPLKPGPAELASAALAARALRRVGHVDQNLVPGQRRNQDDKTPVATISPGAGVQEVPAP